MRAVLPLFVIACSTPSAPEAPPARQHRLAEPAPIAEIDAIEAPRTEPERVDTSLDKDTVLGKPIHDGRLTLVPILAKRDVPLAAFVTFQDGMARGLVSAADTYDVHNITVINRSDNPLVIMGGEVVVGGYQDRAVAQDTTIAAHSTRSVAVFCVEPGRFEGDSGFVPSRAIAEPALRWTLANATPGWDGQGAVWDHVRSINDRDGTSTKTETLRYSLQQQRRGSARASRLAGELDHPRLVGVAIAVDGKLVMIDRFATPGMFRTLRPMLLASYLPGTAGARSTHEITPTEVRAFAARAGHGRPRGNLPAAPN